MKVGGRGSAVVAFNAVNGSPITFAGFLSPQSGRRRRQLRELLERGEGLVLFEGPHRILKLLGDLQELAPARPCLLAREMTKIHEEFLRGTASELAESAKTMSAKGELTVLVEGNVRQSSK